MVGRTGMIFAAQAVASSMSCSSNTCGQPGMVVTAPTEQIIDVLASDVACDGAVPSCLVLPQGDAGCTKYEVLPTALGNCHIDVDLVKGTRFSTDVNVVAGPSACPGFYPAIASNAVIEVP